MAEISTMTQASEFVLDDRPLVRRLEEIGAYFDPVFLSEYHAGENAFLDAGFGHAVAISGDGKTMAVGAPFLTRDDVSEVGAVYIFRHQADRWALEREITQIETGSSQGPRFGWSLALSEEGETLIVGAPFYSAKGEVRRGCAYVFSRNDASWALEERLFSDESESKVDNAEFGYSVAIDGAGQNALIGVPGATDKSAGAACLFEKTQDGWLKETLFRPSSNWYVRLGYSVSLSRDGKTFAVGGPGVSNNSNAYSRAYIFKKRSTGWENLPVIQDGGAGIRIRSFGCAVALDKTGSTLAIAEPVQLSRSVGAIHIYEVSDKSYQKQQELKFFDAGSSADVGINLKVIHASLAFAQDGNMLVAGMFGNEGSVGSCRIYLRSEGKWSLRKELSDKVDASGSAVAVPEDGKRIATTTPSKKVNSMSGAGAVDVWYMPLLDQSSISGLFSAGETPAALAAQYSRSDRADGNMLPHQAFLLAYLRMLETPRQLLNVLPAAHRQLYYRDLLGVSERAVVPDRVAVSFQLDESVAELPLPAGTLLDAGQDVEGIALHYALEKPLLANQSKQTDMRWCWPDGSADNRLIAHVVHDDANERLWPQEGARLFDDNIATIGEEGNDAYYAASGRVVGSPMLSMAGGDRLIKVTFAEPVAPELIDAAVSSADGWISLLHPPVDETEEVTTIELLLPADAPASSPPQGMDDFNDDVALLRVHHRDGLKIPAIASIAVEVLQGPVVYGTDDTLANADDTSYPFRYEPIAGGGFNLVSADWCNKPYEITVTLKPRWADLPETSFKAWYKDYPSGIPENDDEFKIKASIATRTGQNAGPAVSLFATNSGDTKAPVGEPIVVAFSRLPAQATESGDPKDWRAWIRVELSDRDFLHKQYAIGPVQPDPPTKPEDPWPPEIVINEPYTPQWSALDISYVTQGYAPTRQYVLTPFGYRHAESPEDEAHEAAVNAGVSHQLYLGFTGIVPSQDLNLHWQLRSPRPQVLSWEYLTRKNTWKPLAASINDSTGSLFYSGEWACVLPADAATQSNRGQATQMPAGRAWLRGLFSTVARNVPSASDDRLSSYPWIAGVNANAGIAVLQSAELVDSSHFVAPLPAFTITQPVESIEGLEQVRQSWGSFGGRGSESLTDFNTRVAKRLEHRGRVLTWRDVTALLTEAFPEVHDVRVPSAAAAINTSRAFGFEEAMALVVVPKNGKADNLDALRPRFDPARLERMRDYLNSLASVWCNFAPANPVYVDVAIRYDVEFEEGANPEYSHRQLKTALQQHFMPWSEEDGGVAIPGYHLDYYDVVGFMQQQSYVYWVKSLTLTRGDESIQAAEGGAKSVQAASNEVLILVWPEPDA